MRVVHVVPALFGPGGVFGGAERYALELARHMADVMPTTLVSFGEAARDGAASAGCGSGPRPGLARPRPAPEPVSPGSCGELERRRRRPLPPAARRSPAASRRRWPPACGPAVFVSDLGGGGWDVSAYVSTDRWFHGHLHISEYSRQVFGHAGNPRARVIYGGVDTDTLLARPAVPRDGGVALRRPADAAQGRQRPRRRRAGRPAAGDRRPRHDDYRWTSSCARWREARTSAFATTATTTSWSTRTAARCASCCRASTATLYGDETQVPELLGQTLLEGMACGTPAVCTDVASMPEVVEDGVTGFVVPPNDPRALGERLALAAPPSRRGAPRWGAPAAGGCWRSSPGRGGSAVPGRLQGGAGGRWVPGGSAVASCPGT